MCRDGFRRWHRLYGQGTDLGTEMDDLKLNKYAAGVLCGGLLVMAGVKSADVLLPHQYLETNAYPVEVSDTPVAGTASEAPSGPQPILALLASADPAAGEKLSKKCTACHTFDEGGQNKVGPNLWNIVNAQRGGDGDFSYSSSMSGIGGQWSYTELNGFIHRPKSWIEGTKMNYIGMKKPQDRANLIAWIRTLSASPAALPSDADIAAEEAAAETASQ